MFSKSTIYKVDVKSNFTDEWAEATEPILPSEKAISETFIKNIQVLKLQVF